MGGGKLSSAISISITIQATYGKLCTYNGTLTQGAEFTDETYVYRYKQEASTAISTGWEEIDIDGWGVKLKDRDSTDAITVAPCTFINYKPIVSMSNMFYDSKATSIDLSDFDVREVVNMLAMFSGMQNITELNLGENFDTSNVTKMNAMFSSMKNLTSLNLGNKFDTSKVTDMNRMFNYLESLTTLTLGDKFDTSKVTDMSLMFRQMEKLTSLNLGNKFDTSNVTSMSEMFNGLRNVTTLTLGDKFDTSKVTSMYAMFAGMQYLTALNLGDKFDTSNVTSMTKMFGYATYATDTGGYTVKGMESLKQLNLGSKFNTSKVTNMDYMFHGSSSLETLDMHTMSFNMELLTSYSGMFIGIKSGVAIKVKDESAKSFVQERINDAGKTATITAS